MVVSCFSFSTMSVFVKLGSSTLSTAELMFYRASIALLVLLAAIVIPGGYSLKISRPVFRLHAGRSFCGAISMMMATYAMAHLPLPTAITLQNTTPLFLMVLIAGLHRVLPSPAQVFSIGLGFMGVILLLQPTISSELLFPCSMGLLSGLFSAGSMFNIRELGRAGEPEWRVVFYFLLTSTVFSGIWMLVQPYAMAQLDWNNAGIIVAMGVFAGIGQLTVTRAYGKGKSLVVASLSYLTVAFTSVYGILIWKDNLPLLSYAAMLLIAGAGIVSALRSGRS
ncbi:EamA-like transporter family protein [Formivibrio citricus]|uniref:EamA-like transporter family protein n=2 Tax=Formivibrio citricus TaxID=83765 RepID=A0A1I5A201_9NEIS|nr:EamA-like transporter family protein [Formivibrio citricus]